MSLTLAAAAHWNGPRVFTEPRPEPDQRDRIVKALGPLGERSSRVDGETLCRVIVHFPFGQATPQSTQ